VLLNATVLEVYYRQTEILKTEPFLCKPSVNVTKIPIEKL